MKGSITDMLKFIVAAALLAMATRAWAQSPGEIAQHSHNYFGFGLGNSPIMEWSDNTGKIARVEASGQVTLLGCVSPIVCAMIVAANDAEFFGVGGGCGYNFTYFFQNVDARKSVGLRPDGGVEYENIVPTEKSREFYETLSGLFKCGAN